MFFTLLEEEEVDTAASLRELNERLEDDGVGTPGGVGTGGGMLVTGCVPR